MNNDTNFVKWLIEQTDKKNITWHEMPYAVYLHEEDRYILRYMARNEGDIGFYSHLLEKKQYSWDSSTVVFHTNIKNVDIYFLEKTDYDYSLPKHEHSLELIKKSCAKFEDIFSYTVAFENEEKKFALLDMLSKSIKQDWGINVFENAQEFMKDVIGSSGQ